MGRSSTCVGWDSFRENLHWGLGMPLPGTDKQEGGGFQGSFSLQDHWPEIAHQEAVTRARLEI